MSNKNIIFNDLNVSWYRRLRRLQNLSFIYFILMRYFIKGLNKSRPWIVLHRICSAWIIHTCLLSYCEHIARNLLVTFGYKRIGNGRILKQHHLLGFINVFSIQKTTQFSFVFGNCLYLSVNCQTVGKSQRVKPFVHKFRASKAINYPP